MPSGRERGGRKEGCSVREAGVTGQDEAQEILHAVQPKIAEMKGEDRK